MLVIFYLEYISQREGHVTKTVQTFLEEVGVKIQIFLKLKHFPGKTFSAQIWHIGFQSDYRFLLNYSRAFERPTARGPHRAIRIKITVPKAMNSFSSAFSG